MTLTTIVSDAMFHFSETVGLASVDQNVESSVIDCRDDGGLPIDVGKRDDSLHLKTL